MEVQRPLLLGNYDIQTNQPTHQPCDQETDIRGHREVILLTVKPSVEKQVLFCATFTIKKMKRASGADNSKYQKKNLSQANQTPNFTLHTANKKKFPDRSMEV